MTSRARRLGWAETADPTEIGKTCMKRKRLLQGFTYIALLIGIAVLSVGLTKVSELYAKTAERQKWQQFEWAGQQYVGAIRSYYDSSPGSIKRLPPSIQELELDSRFLGVKRHIRELYENPLDDQGRWDYLVGADGGLSGVAGKVDDKIVRFDFRLQ